MNLDKVSEEIFEQYNEGLSSVVINGKPVSFGTLAEKAKSRFFKTGEEASAYFALDLCYVLEDWNTLETILTVMKNVGIARPQLTPYPPGPVLESDFPERYKKNKRDYKFIEYDNDGGKKLYLLVEKVFGHAQKPLRTNT